MPGPHIDACISQCHADVGGCDVWTSSHYNDNGQWWVGWHSDNSFPNWHLGQAAHWTLIGYERWRQDNHGPAWKAHACYAEPNPSLSLAGSNLTPVGHWHITYNQQGEHIEVRYYHDTLTWNEEEAFLKGSGKDKASPKGSGKGKASPKGKGKKGKATGKGRKWARSRARAQLVRRTRSCPRDFAPQ